MLRDIDENLRKRESTKNTFGLDFSILEDPKYNPGISMSKKSFPHLQYSSQQDISETNIVAPKSLRIGRAKRDKSLETLSPSVRIFA